MNKFFGILLFFLSALLMLWAVIGVLGTITGLVSHFPSEGRVLFIQFGKLLLIFPAIAVILFWIYRSATPGKMALKLVVVDVVTEAKPSNA